MVGLLKDIRRALSGEREEADKVIVDRQTQCKQQEDALAHSLKQYQQVLNDLAMDQDHKSVAMGTLKRAVENNRDLTRHLQEEQDAVQIAENDDLDSFALATLVRETAAGANREHVNRNRMYAKTTTDLLSIVQRHFTGVPEERNFGAHDIVRVSSVDSGAEKPAAMLEVRLLVTPRHPRATVFSPVSGLSRARPEPAYTSCVECWVAIESRKMFARLHTYMCVSVTPQIKNSPFVFPPPRSCPRAPSSPHFILCAAAIFLPHTHTTRAPSRADYLPCTLHTCAPLPHPIVDGVEEPDFRRCCHRGCHCERDGERAGPDPFRVGCSDRGVPVERRGGACHLLAVAGPLAPRLDGHGQGKRRGVQGGGCFQDVQGEA